MTESDRIRRNIVIFGQTGCGKSSIINMLADAPIADVSDGASGATLSSKPHDIPHRGDDGYTFWDTAGLNEAENGTVSSDAAVQNLLDIVKDRGVNLLVYCIRPRFVNIIRVNYDLFWKIICMEQVPIVLVVTGLEGRVDMDGWWRENEKVFKGMKFAGPACITSIKGKEGIYEEAYKESADKVWKLVRERSRSQPWHMTAGWSAQAQQALLEYSGKNSKTLSENGMWNFFRALPGLFLTFLSKAGFS